MNGLGAPVTMADVAAEALSWRGTRVHWQAAVKGVGCDCKGLVVGVARALGLPEGDSAWAARSDYGARNRRVPVAELLRGLRETLAPSDGREGSIYLLRVAGQPQHLAIRAGDDLVHAYMAGPRCVTATPLASALADWPLHSTWRFPSVAHGPPGSDALQVANAVRGEG